MKRLNIFFTAGEEDFLSFETDEISYKKMVEIIEGFRNCLMNPDEFKGIEFVTNDNNYYILNHKLISCMALEEIK